MSLRTETSSYNMRYLLHLINVYVIEDVPFCPGLVGTVVKLIQEKVFLSQTRRGIAHCLCIDLDNANAVRRYTCGV